MCSERFHFYTQDYRKGTCALCNRQGMCEEVDFYCQACMGLNDIMVCNFCRKQIQNFAFSPTGSKLLQLMMQEAEDHGKTMAEYEREKPKRDAEAQERRLADGRRIANDLFAMQPRKFDKIRAIRMVRDASGLGIKESKEVVEAAMAAKERSAAPVNGTPLQRPPVPVVT